MRRLALLAVSVALCVASPCLAFKPEYEFARIEQLAEQVVGERLLLEVYRRAGIRASVEKFPAARALALACAGVKDGETLRVYEVGIDCPALLRIETPLSSLTTAAFVRKGSGIRPATKDDLKRYRVVVVLGVQHTKNFTSDMPNVHAVASCEQMFNMIRHGRADVALTNGFNGLAQMRVTGATDIEMVDSHFEHVPLYHYIHENNKEIMPLVSGAVSEMARSGELAILRMRFESEYLDDIGVGSASK